MYSTRVNRRKVNHSRVSELLGPEGFNLPNEGGT